MTALVTAAARASALLGALGAALALGAAPASAHTRLVGTEPEAATTVDEPPTAVVLHFSEPVNQTIGEVTVRSPGGTAISDGGARIDGARVEQPLGDVTEAGEYAVSYRVVASDGHPLTGTFGFTYDGPSPAGDAEPLPHPTAGGAEPLPQSTATPDAPATRDAEAHDAAAATVETAEPLPWLLLGLTAAALLGVLGTGARAVRTLVRWPPQ